jgi:4-amino-4-deoxy-L-arabinose transferase-like glycosyltransferase
MGLALAVGLLVALSLWMRVSSLEALPDIDGDEAWYGVQAGRILRGQPYSLWTAHHNPVNPLHIGIVGLVLTVARPELWVLRVPCLLAGLAAIPATYWLMARALDRGTALIAAVLMAVLPVSIVWSRTGYDGSQLLLFSVLALAAAYHCHRGALFVMGAVCFLAHPTAIFMAPALGAVVLARSGTFDASVPLRRRWLRIGAVVVASLGVVLFGLVMLRRPGVQHLMSVYHLGYARQHDWREFWGWFGRLFLVVGRVPRPQTDRVFWIVVLPVLAVGSWRMAARRRWDRLALIVGVIVSAVGMALVGGTTILQPGMTRYGLALVAPSAVAFACLLTELLEGFPRNQSEPGRLLRSAALVGLGWVGLFSLKMEELDLLHVRDATPGPSHDTIWTFSSGERNPSKRALCRILRDIARTPGDRGPRTLLAEDWQTYTTLSYLSLDEPRVSVVNLADLGQSPDFPARFRDLLERHAYGIGAPGAAIEVVGSGTFGPQALDRWAVPRYGQQSLQVLRLRPSPALAVAPDGSVLR